MIRGQLSRARGKHANIPDCCIEYYMKTWRFLMPKLLDKLYNKQRRDIYYVQCPKHFKKGKYNKLHLCGSGCPVYLGPLRGKWRVI